jgi:DNA polymerase III subunit beta
MKVNRKEFIKALSRARNFTSKTLPITEKVLVDPGSGIISASNLEQYIVLPFEASGQIDEAYCVDPRQLMNILKTDEHDEVEIKKSPEYSYLIVGENFDLIPTDNADDFPTIAVGFDSVQYGFSITDEQAKLMASLELNKNDKIESAHHLNAWLKNGSLASTDLKRLYALTMNDAKFEMEMAVPKAMLFKAAQIGAGKVDYSIDGKTYVIAECGDTGIKVYSSVLDGDYPGLQDLARKHDLKVNIKKATMKYICDRAMQMQSDEYRATVFKFNGGLSVAMSNPNKGEYKELFDIGKTIEPEIKMGLNPKFILEAIGAVKGDEVELSIKDGSEPIVIANPGSEDYLSVIMPMKV